MKTFVRFGRRLPIPSTVQILHELMQFCADDDARKLAAEKLGGGSTPPVIVRAAE
ncbi:MAG: hypothetical protein WCA81_08720 [Rhizomicrobium sp.]|jgi:hypothetical protein